MSQNLGQVKPQEKAPIKPSLIEGGPREGAPSSEGAGVDLTRESRVRPELCEELELPLNCEFW